MQADFDPSLKIILKEEGGNDDDPRDPGGRTSRGIIQREWDAYRDTHPGRPADVWKASDTDVADIYRNQYWNPYCDRMSPGIDLVFFNTAVNSGRQQAVKELQRALGVQADGMMGMITFQALDATSDPEALIKNQCDQRRKFYRALKTFSTFGKGWLARTDRIEKSALDMAEKNPISHPNVDTLPATPGVTVSAKAPVADAAQPVVAPETAGAVSAGTGSISATIAQVQSQLQPFADSTTITWIKYVLLALTIAGIIVTVYGIIKKNKVQQVIN